MTRPGRAANLIGAWFALQAAAGSAWAESRFPQPGFESGYRLPETPEPLPRIASLELLDVAVLTACLALASHLALRRRSRAGLVALTLFAAGYFGFWRSGCVCPVGGTQNVFLALFEPAYALPPVVLAFFLLPLLFALFTGRTFCAGVCPLGALQDLVVLRPLRVPPPLEEGLRLLPPLYLGVAALLAASGAGFVVCRFDPMVPFYRLAGGAPMLLAGAAVLLLGSVVARPYCRYLCPYGVLLSWCSRLSRRHTTVTPAECVECRLCERACPFGAIQVPTQSPQRPSRRRLGLLLVAVPLLALAGGLLGWNLDRVLARSHPTVQLAERLQAEHLGAVEGTTPASDGFRQSDQPAAQLYAEAARLQRRFAVGGALLGGCLGALFGGRLLALALRRSRPRQGYLPDRGRCLSCGRCFAFCPVEQVRRHGGEAYPRLLAGLEKARRRGTFHGPLPGPEVMTGLAPPAERSNERG